MTGPAWRGVRPIALLVVLSSLEAAAQTPKATVQKPPVRWSRRVEEAGAKAVTRALSPVTRRAQVGAQLLHVLDGLRAVSGEPLRSPDPVERNPLGHRLRSAEEGWRLHETERLLAEYTTELERSVERIQVPHPIASAGQGLIYRAERAAWLALLKRQAKDLSSTFVHARAILIKRHGRDPVYVGARDIYVETWRVPQGIRPRGVIRLGPGYQELGSSFYVLIDALNRQGIEVQVMDQQWAGYTMGEVGPGQVDSKEGIARDGVFVDGLVQKSALVRGLPFASVGQSMGGGPGLILAYELVKEGVLSGPIGAPPLVGLAPYLGYTPNLQNELFGFLGRHVPLFRAAPFPMLPIPKFNHGSEGAQVAIAASASRSMIAGRAEALPRGALDARELAAAKHLPNPITVVMGERDTVADRAAVALYLPKARFVDIGGEFARDHIQQHTTEVRAKIVDAILASLGLERLPGT